MTRRARHYVLGIGLAATGRRSLVIAVTAGVVLMAVAGCGSSAATRTVTVNSATCVQGYRVAGRSFTIMGNALRAAAGYPPLIEQAAKAGTTQDFAEITAIAARERQINAKIAGLAGQLRQLGDSFNPAPGGCS